MKKATTASDAIHLEQIPNIGKSVANDLRLIGITKPIQLRAKDPLKLYQKINIVTRTHHDPCLLDTFMAAVDFMNGGRPKPWWKFTERRKGIR